MSLDDIAWHPAKWRGLARAAVYQDNEELTCNKDHIAALETKLLQEARRLRDIAQRQYEGDGANG